MTHKIESSHGDIILNEGVLARLVGMATTECYGVAGMAPRNLGDELAAILGHESLAKGVIIDTTDRDDALDISVNIVVGYGVNIGEVARNVKEKVVYVVDHCTGLSVEKVNVNVQGVKVDKQDEQ